MIKKLGFLAYSNVLILLALLCWLTVKSEEFLTEKQHLDFLFFYFLFYKFPSVSHQTNWG